MTPVYDLLWGLSSIPDWCVYLTVGLFVAWLSWLFADAWATESREAKREARRADTSHPHSVTNIGERTRR